MKKANTMSFQCHSRESGNPEYELMQLDARFCKHDHYLYFSRDAENWRYVLQENLSDDKINEIQKKSQSGRPMGKDEFISELGKQT